MMRMMRRYPDWRRRLTAYLSSVQRTPHKDGEHDCALFAASALEAMTGTDLAARWRGRYTTLRGGLRILKKEGYADHVDVARQHLSEIPPRYAQAGDVAVVAGEGGEALGIVQGERIYVLTPGGLATVSLTEALRAWRVG